MTSTSPTTDDPEVAALVARTAEAANAWLQGDMDRYLELTLHAPGFTLTRPDGGAPVQHADRRSEFEGWQSPFADGEAELEIAAVHAWGDTAVLVMIERQHGRIGEQPDRDLSMRVSHVYRRTAAGWELVHRHADPLVAPVAMEQLMAVVGG